MTTQAVQTTAAPPTSQQMRQRLFAYLRPHALRLGLGLTCGVFAGLVQTGIAAALKNFVNGLQTAATVKNGDASTLAWVCGGVIALYVVMGFLKYGQTVFLSAVAQRVGIAMRRDVYAHLQTLSLSFFHRRRTGALMSVLTNDVSRLQNAAMMIKDVVATPVQALAILAYMFVLSWKLTLFSLIVVPFMAVGIQRLTRRLRGISTQAQQKQADIAAIMEETLSAPRIVRAFSAETHEVERFTQANDAAFGIQMKSVRRSGRLGPVVDVIGATGIALTLWMGGREVAAGRMDVGGLLAFLLLLSQMANSVGAIGGLRSSWEEMMGAADRLFSEVLDVNPEIADAPGAVVLPPVAGRVEFSHVQFGYDEKTPVLQNINLTIEPGQVVALVGETGAGKSTLADLVPRFYDPTAGTVSIDGYDLRTVTVASLREQIGIVPQETLLFAGTIRDNIAYGRRDATDADIEAAARAANADSFIQSYPTKYQTRIGERGTTLSGGERQRIAIARALLANPRILILDEATSALDASTEALVQEALETLMQNRTTLIIAHRLSTIVNADKIVVLKRGGIIAETGTHAELLKKNGVYAALYETQRKSADTAAQGGEVPVPAAVVLP